MIDKILYKIKFYRFNTCVEPMMKQETDVIFRTELPVWEHAFIDVMWDEMWSQNPAWLLSHGPRTVNFSSWSSVMCDRETLKEVKQTEKDMPEDLTGEGNMFTALTFHPLLPSDMRLALRKAYERGLAASK